MGPGRVRGQERVATRGGEFSLEESILHAVCETHRLRPAEDSRRAWMGKRADVCTFARRLEHPCRTRSTRPHYSGTAHRKGGREADAHPVESQEIGGPTSGQDPEEKVAWDHTPRAPATGR